MDSAPKMHSDRDCARSPAALGVRMRDAVLEGSRPPSEALVGAEALLACLDAIAVPHMLVASSSAMIVFANKAARVLWAGRRGTGAPPLVGMFWDRSLTGRRLCIVANADTNAAGLELDTVEEVVFRTRDGDVPVRVSIAESSLPLGGADLRLMTLEDQRQLHAARRGQENAERRLRASLGLLDAAVWELDVATNRLSWSGDADRLLGVATALTPRSTDDLIALVIPDDRPTVERGLRSVGRSLQDVDLTFRIARRHGDSRRLRLRGSRDDHAPVGRSRWTGVLVDDAAAGSSADDAAAHATLSSRLSATRGCLDSLVDGLRGPTSAILAWTRASMCEWDDDQLEHARRRILDSAREQVRWIEEVASASASIDDLRQLDIRSLDLARMVRATVAAMRWSAAQRGVRLEMEVPRDDRHECGANEQAMAQLLWHALWDVVDCAGAGGRAHVELGRFDGDLIVTMSAETSVAPSEARADSDGGMAAPTVRLDRRIGITMARHIARLHGGSMEVRDEALRQCVSIQIPGQILRDSDGEHGFCGSPLNR